MDMKKKILLSMILLALCLIQASAYPYYYKIRLYNENGEPYCNALDGVYKDESVWAEAKGVDNNEPPYGWAYINIDARGHALHGGGSNLGSGYNEPFQTLTPTLGCFRMYNADVYHLALMFLEAEKLGIKPCITVVS